MNSTSSSLSSARFGLALALASCALVAACGGSSENLSVGSDNLKTDGGETDGGGGSADGGTPCTTAAECGVDGACGFPDGAACSAVGVCFSTKGLATCAAYLPGCACDGTTINTICSPVPTGYTTKPLAHAGACMSGAADAAAPCTVDADCGASGRCGYAETAACSAKGVCFPQPGGVMCNAVEQGCACDGSFVNLACNGLPSGYASKPVRHSGACTDGG